MRALGFVFISIFGLWLAACSSKPPTGGLCQPGKARCDLNAYQICSDDGERWVTQTDCTVADQVCLGEVGCLNCFPGSLGCGGDGFDIVRCREDGSANDILGRCDPESGDLCTGGNCTNACAYTVAQHSYEGCDYWAVDLDNAVVSDQGTAAAQQYSIVVSNPLELPADVTVEVNDAPPGMPPQIRVVDQKHLSRIPGGGDLAIFDLPPREVDGSSDPHLNDGSGTMLSSNAYHVRSSAPIVAYQFNPLENVGVFSNDASLLLPTPALGNDYLVMGWAQTLAITSDPLTNGTIDLRAFLTVVGTEADTHVMLQPATRILGSADIPPTDAFGSINLTIGAYDVINLESDGFNADFTSSFITSDKPIAVFSGSEASDVPMFDTWLTRDCCADHLEEQLFPETAFGTNFVAVKTPLRTKYVEQAGWNVALVPDEPEYWRVMATGEDTVVVTNLPAPNNAFSLLRGQYVTFESERDFLLWANHPVSFAQFPASQQTTGIPPVGSNDERIPGGDPSLIIVPPIEQWRSKYVFLTPNKYAFDFILMAVPVGVQLVFDGVILENIITDCEYEPIGTLMPTQTEYVAIRCPLSHPVAGDDPNNPIYQDDGRHVIESLDDQVGHENPFGLVVWGWDSYVSYGYAGGANINIINQQ